jgi:hypothetical protein
VAIDLTDICAPLEVSGLLAAGGLGGLQLLLLVLAVIGLTGVLVSTSRRVRRAQRPDAAPARERYAQTEKQQHATRDLERVMLELDQLSRQIHGRIDTKVAILEALIRDADERIARLSELAATGQHGPAIPLPDPAPEPGRDPPPQEPPADHPDVPQRAPDDADTRYAEVYDLADGGLAPVDIAGRVGRTAGEVELILALRKTRAAAS